MLRDLGVLVVRLTVGGLLAGHGAQKALGWFGGHGLEGTGGWFEGMGFRPGRRWASLASFSELGGGLMTALGFLNPVGPLAAMGAMLVATLKVHRGKPIWVTEGGAELPVTNLAVLGAVAIAGPGRLSIDHALGTRLPRWTVVPGAMLVGAATWYAVEQSERARAGTIAGVSATRPETSEGSRVAVPSRLDVVGASRGSAELTGESGTGAGFDADVEPGEQTLAGTRDLDVAAISPATPDRA